MPGSGLFSLTAWRNKLADRARDAAIRLAFVAVALVFAGIALVLLLGTAVILLADEWGLPVAMAVVAGGAVLVALLLAWLGVRRRPVRSRGTGSARPAASSSKISAELPHLVQKHPAEALLAAFAVGITLATKPEAIRVLADVLTAGPRRTDAGDKP